MREQIYSSSDRSSRTRMAKRISKMNIDIIDKEAKKTTTTRKEGPRSIFLKKYKLTGDFEKSKKELSEQGYSPEIFEDETLQKWIDEER